MIEELDLDKIKRGEVYIADLGDLDSCRGSEQRGIRPVVIIQNDIGNLHSPVTIVAIITSKKKTRLPTHVLLTNSKMDYKYNTIMLEQVRTIDKNRLKRKICSLDEEEMEKMNRAISISMGV